MLDLKNGDTVVFGDEEYMIGELISLAPHPDFEACYHLVFEDTKGKMHRYIVDETCKKEAACD